MLLMEQEGDTNGALELTDIEIIIVENLGFQRTTDTTASV